MGGVDRRPRGCARSAVDDERRHRSALGRPATCRSSSRSRGGSGGSACATVGGGHASDDDVRSADIVDRFFESEQVKTVMALNGLIGTWAGPHEPGTGYVMAHHSIGDVGGRTLSAPGPRRSAGMGAVAAALESQREEPRCGDPHRGSGRHGSSVRGRPRPRRPPRRRRGGRRSDRRGRHPPEDHVPPAARRRRAAGGLRRGHQELEVAERHGQDQSRARSRPGVHRGPRAPRL